jgi:ribosomal-protein-alanine N-acetyltransferase
MVRISLEAFPASQPPANYRREFANPLAHYMVAVVPPGTLAGPLAGTVIGYAGLWLMAGEAHIVDIAVQHDRRRSGLGELLLICLLDLAVELKACLATLEVRASNQPAYRLYTKYGFKTEGRRRRYYNDNGEDALIMTAGEIGSPSFRKRLDGRKKAHMEKWGSRLFSMAC